jgi:exopolysaccharide biosynthesis polyprenyl glycosylphosphotransferase
MASGCIGWPVHAEPLRICKKKLPGGVENTMRKILYLLVYAPSVAVADLFLVQISLVPVFFLKWAIAMPRLGVYVHVLPWICWLSLWMIATCGLYRDWLRCGERQLIYRLCLSSALICLVIVTALWWEGQPWVPLVVLANIALIQFALLALYRLLLRKFYWMAMGRSRAMVMANDEDQAVALTQKLEPIGPHWMHFAGYLVVTDIEKLDQMSRSFDCIVMAPGFVEARALIRKCTEMHKNVMAVPACLELSLLRAHTLEIEDMLVLDLKPPRLSAVQAWMKRVLDLVLSTLLLMLSSPLLLLTFAAIRLTSKGPAIFKQDRVGRDGVEFTLYKFRTMIADAEVHTGPVLAQQCDPRITRIGQWMRATRVDELPQLLNVLIGDMSLIGPRPEREFFVSKFRATVPEYGLRLAVKPGITGLAQVAGGYTTPVEQKLRFDLLYIHDYSLMLDLSILFRTVLVVFQGQRAEGLKGVASSIVVEEQ